MMKFVTYALFLSLLLSCAVTPCSAQEDVGAAITEYVADYVYAPVPFSDISGHWAENYISMAARAQYMNGIGNQRFAPDETVTRAMAVQVLYNLAGQPKSSAPLPFRDIPNHAWYKNAVAWAFENGITIGISATTFAPEQSITREQLVTILYRYVCVKSYDKKGFSYLAECATIDRFSDRSQLSSYAETSMLWALGNQIVCGRNEMTLAPEREATRAELAKILVCFAAYTPGTAYRLDSVRETPQESSSYRKEGNLPDLEAELYAALKRYGIKESTGEACADVIFECAAALSDAAGSGKLQRECYSEITSSFSVASLLLPNIPLSFHSFCRCTTQQEHYSSLSQGEKILCSSLYFQDCMTASMELIAEGIYSVAVEKYGYTQIFVSNSTISLSCRRSVSATENTFSFREQAEIAICLQLHVCRSADRNN